MISNIHRKDTPVVIVGSGLAGLMAAAMLADTTEVIVLTKQKVDDSNTRHSQGGIAAVWSEDDSSELHVEDTLQAGRGYCKTDAVEILSKNSKAGIKKLIQLGVSFDKNSNGDFLLGLEGAHSIPRILYAGGDATGAEIQRALTEYAISHNSIRIIENAFVTTLKKNNGLIQQLEYLKDGAELKTIECNQVVLATGGAGRIYQHTSNPITATGEGTMLAYLAGAELADLEFYQFHPTGLAVENAPNFLISEAVRGEGAVLRNQSGFGIMEGIHPQKDLAPRDIVARTIAKEISKSSNSAVYLDATSISSSRLVKRFPTIFENCQKYGVDIRKDPIPVVPVAHYMIGGVMSDLCGRTNVPGLYVCGEVARTGVHGANRLASNSLLECVVFSSEAAKAILLDRLTPPEFWLRSDQQIDAESETRQLKTNSLELSEFRNLMWRDVGLTRDKESLLNALELLKLESERKDASLEPRAIEFNMMKKLGQLMAFSAVQRQESRGSHYRSDYPNTLKNFSRPLVRSLQKDEINN